MVLGLYDYILIARKIIRKYAGTNTYAVRDAELEGDVARAIMVADETFDPSKEIPLETWRWIRAVYFIRRYFAKRKKTRMGNRPRFAVCASISGLEAHIVYTGGRLGGESPDEKLLKEEEHRDRVEFLTELLRESALTKRQLRYMHRYYVDEKTLEEIAAEFETSVQNCQQALSQSLDKIRAVL